MIQVVAVAHDHVAAVGAELSRSLCPGRDLVAAIEPIVAGLRWRGWSGSAVHRASTTQLLGRAWLSSTAAVSLVGVDNTTGSLGLAVALAHQASSASRLHAGSGATMKAAIGVVEVGYGRLASA